MVNQIANERRHGVYLKKYNDDIQLYVVYVRGKYIFPTSNYLDNNVLTKENAIKLFDYYKTNSIFERIYP